MTDLSIILGTMQRVQSLKSRIGEVQRVLSCMNQVVGAIPGAGFPLSTVVTWFNDNGPGFPQLDTVDNALTLLERAIRQANYPLVVEKQEDTGDAQGDEL